MATELAKAYVQIIPSAKGMTGMIKKELDGEVGSAGDSAGGLFGGKLLGKLKGIIAAAGIGKMLTDTIMEGAKLEQSMGGIDTLFKDSADKMKAYAADAYKTVGISANDYMEQATSFSASLLQSLGGDTDKAADMANMALKDMGDNANKFGTDMQSIQNAYQGFAKQNYTMLDNLKLGYGGTKTEMQRLLADAQQLTGVKYDISNLSDVYEAIHVIQENLDVTGTTAKEASSTLSGSFASMKAAALDFMGNLTLGRDVGESLKNMLSSVFTFAGNLVPAILNIISGLYEAIVSYFSDGTIIAKAQEMVTNISTSMRERMPEMIQSGVEVLENLIKGITTGLPKITGMAWELIGNFVAGVIENLPQIIQAGIQLLTSLHTGMISSLPEYAKKAMEMMGVIIDAIKSVDWLQAGKDIINTVKDGLIAVGTALWDTTKQLFAMAKEKAAEIDWISAGKLVVTKIIDGLFVLSGALWQATVEIGKLALKKFKQIDWKQLGKDVMNLVIAGINLVGTLLWTAVKLIAEKAKDKFKEIDWIQLGKDIIHGIVKGLEAVGGAVKDFLLGMAESALNAVKGFFGIASPSKVMRDQVGKMIGEGLAIGITKSEDAVQKAMDELIGVATPAMDFNATVMSDQIAADPDSTGNNRMVTINVYPSEGMDEISLAQRVGDLLEKWTRQEEAVYA